ncbi:MAG: hypothetical protein QM278_10300 [Pseudomonadota bacterium]|nr:hypothetical protein [Pseudomonadota bacterium]
MLLPFVALSMLIAPGLAAALSPEQVLSLKKAGVSEATIQLMIRQEMAAQEGGNDSGVREIRDGDGRTVTVYSPGPPAKTGRDREREDVEKAWNMLQHLIVDGRK